MQEGPARVAPRHPPLLGHNPTLIHAANDSPAPAARRGHAEGGGGDWGEGEVFIAADVLGHTCRRREVRPVVWVEREAITFLVKGLRPVEAQPAKRKGPSRGPKAALPFQPSIKLI